MEAVADVVSEADELVFSASSSSESTLLAVQLAGVFEDVCESITNHSFH